MSNANDTFDAFPLHLQGPARSGFAISPSDGAGLLRVTRGLYVGVAGNVALVLADDSEVTLLNLAAGVVHPLRIKQVKATGTTATDLVGFD